MIIIKNSKELKKYLDEDRDLILKDQDVRIEYQVAKGELRNVYCRDLSLMNDDQKFDFNGWNFNGGNFNGLNFNGWNFTGRNFTGRDFNGGNFNGLNFNGWNFNGLNFNGWNFTGRNFTGRDFNGGNFNGLNFNGWNFTGRNFTGRDFNGWNFTGKKVSYWAFFNGYGKCKCESIEGIREPHAEPCFLGGIEIIKPDEPQAGKKVRIKIEGGQELEGTLIE
jgi:hypothetical protein